MTPEPGRLCRVPATPTPSPNRAMHRILTASVCAAGLLAPHDLSTDYRPDRILVVESTISFEAKVTDFEVLIDGQPPEGLERASDQSSTLTITTVHADQVMKTDDGSPTQVQREFRSLSGTTARSAGGEEDSTDLVSPLDGATLELTDDDGEVAVTALGENDLEEAQLKGHRLTLALDVLLPGDEMNEGDSWELDSEAIADALGIQRHGVLFPRRPADAGRGNGERGNGRRRGRRGGAQAGGLNELQHLDWEGTAELSGTEDYEGIDCWVIELEMEATGELPEQAQGRRGRDRAVQPPSTQPALALQTTMEIELKGRLLVSVEGRRPVHLHLNGDFGREMERSMDRGERTMEMTSSSEGTLTLNVDVSEESPE